MQESSAKKQRPHRVEREMGTSVSVEDAAAHRRTQPAVTEQPPADEDDSPSSATDRRHTGIAALDSFGHDPQHKGDALAQKAMPALLALKVGAPDIEKHRYRQSGHVRHNRLHED
jgi:hypothetical protein